MTSLMTAAPDELLTAVRALAESARRGTVAGIHLEGPWLSPKQCGAHDHRQLRDPDPAEIDALVAAGDGAIRMVTLAPELPGGIDAIKRFVDAGVVVAVGHTDATYDQTRQAIDAGASVGTHLFNAMRPVHQREPGPVLALLQDPRVTVEIIGDGVHVHPALIRHVIGVAGPHRVALVTDATAAAGSADGRFRLGGRDVDVVSGVARMRGTSTIAGGTATMDQLFQTAVPLLSAGGDDALAATVQLTSTTAARTLGLEHVGRLGVGQAANLVVLNHDLQVIRVMSRGEWS
jgi:N-acetylglucosamine-6-phosphate deacetylase